MGHKVQSLMDVILVDAGRRPNGIYRLVNQLTALSNEQAKRVVDSAPGPIVTHVPTAHASSIKRELEQLGARASLISSADSSRLPTDLAD